MEKAKRSLSLICPEHEMPIGMLNTDPNAKKIGYCYECIDESDGTVNLKSVASYLKDIASAFEACRQRASACEPPAEYLEELSKKGERLVRLSQHIDSEKDRVKKGFEEVRKKVTQVIDQKEKDYLERLDREITGLSELYLRFEKHIFTGRLRASDLQAMYPDLDVLKQRLSKVENIDQLQAFMVGIQEDIESQIDNNMEKEIYATREEIDILIGQLTIPESSFPKAESKLLKPENVEIFMKSFIREQVGVANSIVLSALSSERMSFFYEQFEAIRAWFPHGYKTDYFKLLYKGTVDGMSPQALHQKCDGKGATITLIKCRFPGIEEPHVIGGFLDKSLNSNQGWTSSEEAFLFSLSGHQNPIKCPIYRVQSAFYGTLEWGLKFGEDLQIEKTFKAGRIGNWAYSNASLLSPTKASNFLVEEVEVYQVQESKEV